MTSFKLVVWDAFWFDLAEGSAWYDEQEFGVGAEFEEAVVHLLDSIQDRPSSFPVWRGQIRRATMKRYPYSVAFVVDPGAVHVLGLVHGKRDLPRWIKRRLNG